LKYKKDCQAFINKFIVNAVTKLGHIYKTKIHLEMFFACSIAGKLLSRYCPKAINPKKKKLWPAFRIHMTISNYWA